MLNQVERLHKLFNYMWVAANPFAYLPHLFAIICEPILHFNFIIFLSIIEMNNISKFLS